MKKKKKKNINQSEKLYDIWIKVNGNDRILIDNGEGRRGKIAKEHTGNIEWIKVDGKDLELLKLLNVINLVGSGSMEFWGEIANEVADKFDH